MLEQRAQNNAEQFEDVVCAIGSGNELPNALPSTIDGERDELPG